MAMLHYSVIASLDGYVADEEGNFDWAEPEEEVHSFVNEFVRSHGTYLYGRRMYEVMVAWEALDLSELPSHIPEFARIWQEADKAGGGIAALPNGLRLPLELLDERRFNKGTVYLRYRPRR
jgi:hypothetical protein